MISKKLTELRKIRGFTQKDVANKLKIPRSTYSNYETGLREPDLSMIEFLANLFGVTVDELLGRETKVKNIKETEIEKINSETNELLKSAKNVEQALLILDLAKSVFKNDRNF